MPTRRITYRLYPTRQQEQQLHYWRRLHCTFYNAAIANRKTQYQKFGHSVDYLEQQNCLPEFKKVWTEYKPLGSHALQATLKRVDMAFRRFFSGLGGYPRFKASRRYSGWSYPCKQSWKAITNGDNGKLSLTNLGEIKMRGKARTWGTPTTCTIFWRHNKWYASITVECVPTRDTDVGAVGIDFGTFHALALSDGTVIDNPRFLGTPLGKVKRASKQKRRKRAPNRKKRICASKRWRKAQAKVSKLNRKITRQRSDWQHKVAAQIVACNSLVATEKLQVRSMTRKAKGKNKRQKAGLNRSLLDVGISAITSLIKYKLDEAGGIFVDVPLKIAPSQTCPNCGSKRKKDLSERIHTCNCGIAPLDRDVAAAIVMLDYAKGVWNELPNNRGSCVPTSKPTNCGGWKQTQEMRRQKLSALRSDSEVAE